MADQTTMKAINIPEFFGDPKKDTLTARAWCNQVVACQKLSEWAEDKTAQFALLRLRSVAASWANNQLSLDADAFSTWTKLQKGFFRRFAIRRTLAELAFLKNSLVMSELERVRDFFDRVVSCQIILDEDWEDLDDDATDEQKRIFKKAKEESQIRGVRLNFTSGVHEDIRKMLLIEKVKSNEELLELAERIESSVRDQKRIFNDTKHLEVAAATTSRGRNANRGRGRGGRSSSFQKGDSKCFLCSSLEHWADRCPNRGQSQWRSRGRGRGQFRGQFRGRGGFTQLNSRTASIGTSQYDSNETGHNGQLTSNPIQQQQQQQQQSQQHKPSQSNDSAEDPYFHIVMGRALKIRARAEPEP